MRRFAYPTLRRRAGDQAVGDASLLSRMPSIPTFQEMRPALEGELRRCRRYERPLSIMIVVPDLGELARVAGKRRRAAERDTPGNGSHLPLGAYDRRGAGSISGASLHPVDPATLLDDDAESAASIYSIYSEQLSYLLLGALMCDTLRESDVVSYAAEDHQFCAMLPECDLTAAQQAVERLHRLYHTRMATSVRAGVAVYPADGLTLDDLMAHARTALIDRPFQPSITPRVIAETLND